MDELSHLDKDGRPRMKDVGDKESTERTARASIVVRLNKTTFDLVKNIEAPKGNVLTVAQLAGIQAAKRTADLIPLCHTISLSHIDLTFTLDDSDLSIRIVSSVRAYGQTGVEMEALTACSVAALTVYDMVKSAQKDVVIDDLRLLEKKGGKSGDFHGKDS